MNLAEMLSYADIHQLNRIARHYACECNTNSKRELIQSILNKVNRKDVFERYVEELTVEDIRFLNSLAFDQRDAFSLEELLARAQISRYEAAGPTTVGGRPQERSDILSTVTVDLRRADEPPSASKPKARARSKSAKTSVELNGGAAGDASSAGTPNEPRADAKARSADAETGRESRWSPRETIVKFAHQGWLFNGYSQQTKYLYQVPADLKRRFGDSLEKAFLKRVRYTGEPPVYRDEQRLLSEDIGRFLRYLNGRPAELNAEGAMYKRTQQAILDELNVKEELVGKGGWRFGYGRRIKEYPNRFSLLYDYCFYNGLIEETDGSLALTEEGEAHVAQGKQADPGAIYQFWLKLYKNPIHNLQSIVHWIERLATDWATLDSLADALKPLIKPFYYDTPDSIFRHRIVLMMMHQGLLRIGETPEDGAVVVMTKLGSSIVRGVYVPEEEKIALPDDDEPARQGR